MTWKGQSARLGRDARRGHGGRGRGKMTARGCSRNFAECAKIAGGGRRRVDGDAGKAQKALAAEGLFDRSARSRCPICPTSLGCDITQGAVIRDILHRLRDRFPRKVLVWPVAVQGQSSQDEVAAAIAGFNALTPGGALPRPDLSLSHVAVDRSKICGALTKRWSHGRRRPVISR